MIDSGIAGSPDLVVLISGNGSNLQAIIDAIRDGHLQARVNAVISNDADAFGLLRAKEAGIPAITIPHTAHADRADYDRMLGMEVDRYRPDLIILAGFMRILGPGFVRRFPGRILNIHPSLLPRYKGTDTHRRVLESGDNEHGASVHVVTEALDEGPIIQQARVPVLAGDDAESLAQRVLAQEHRLYPAAIARYWEAISRKDGGNIFTTNDQDMPQV